MVALDETLIQESVKPDGNTGAELQPPTEAVAALTENLSQVLDIVEPDIYKTAEIFGQTLAQTLSSIYKLSPDQAQYGADRAKEFALAPAKMQAELGELLPSAIPRKFSEWLTQQGLAKEDPLLQIAELDDLYDQHLSGAKIQAAFQTDDLLSDQSMMATLGTLWAGARTDLELQYLSQITASNPEKFKEVPGLFEIDPAGGDPRFLGINPAQVEQVRGLLSAQEKADLDQRLTGANTSSPLGIFRSLVNELGGPNFASGIEGFGGVLGAIQVDFSYLDPETESQGAKTMIEMMQQEGLGKD